MEEKIKTIIWIVIGVVIFISVISIVFLLKGRSSDPTTGNRTIDVQEPQWAYCWTDPTSNRGRCGKVTKIKTEGGNIINLVVYWPTTKVTTDYWKIPFNEVGEYSQPGEKGTWFLKKISRNKYSGWEKDETGKKMVSFLEIVKRI